MVFGLSQRRVPLRRGWRRSLHGVLTAVLVSSASLSPGIAWGKGEADSKKSPESQPKSEKEDEQEEPTKDSNESSENATASASVTTEGGAANGSFEMASGDMKPTVLFVDVGFRSDISLLYQRTTIGRFQEQEDFDVKAYGPMIHVGMLTKLFWKLRIGAALGYGFHYELDERLTEFELEEEIEPDRWVLGQLYTGDIRVEFSQLLTKNLYVLATPRGGIQAVIPGEHLLAERETYEGAYNVRQGPQWGVLGGFDIGARYLIFDWLAARLTAGYAYYTQGLLKAKRKSDTVTYTALWRLSGARVGGNLGLEAVF